MNLVNIAWKSIRQRSLASSLTALSVALGVALMVTVLVINSVVTKMFSQSMTGYDLVVGAKGSAMQLVLNTIYFLDKPIENLPYSYYQKIRNNSGVSHAIPFCLGDTTQDGRFRIVGTIPEYFDIEYMPKHKFQFQPGGGIMKDPFDAVIGARVARSNGWSVGSQFSIAHGGNLEDVHAEKFTVKGILAPTGTPNDGGVFIHLDGFYMIPGHEKPLDEVRERDKAFGLEIAEETPSRERRTFQGPDGKVYKELPDSQKEVTAILVRVKFMTFAPMLQASIKKGPLAQAANPIAEIGKLLRNIVGNIRTVLVVMTALIIVVSGVSIFVSIYNSMSDRRREIAIMRALGASRTTVFSIIIAESILLCVGGGILGFLIGHTLVFIASPVVEARSEILLNPWAFELDELIILPALIVLATIVGLVPGLTAYRTDVARGLAE